MLTAERRRRSSPASSATGRSSPASSSSRSASPTTPCGATCASWPPAGSCSACTAGRCRPRRAAVSFAQRLQPRARGEGAPRRGGAAAAGGRERAAARRRDDGARARAPAAARPRLHGAHQLAAGRRGARRPPARRGRADRRSAAQGLARHRRRRRRVEALRQVRADVCVLGICSLHPELGITVTHHDEAYVKRAMVEASAEVIALATADKLHTASPWVVAPARRRDAPGDRRGRGPDRRVRRRPGVTVVPA